ncbi:MAG: ATP-binding protein [Candidatus Omnitrophota bacterium]
MNYQKMNKLIKEAKNISYLCEIILKGIDGLDAKQRKQLMKSINVRITQLDKNEKAEFDGVRRSIHSERLAAMGHMAAAISHELRNPLSGIKVAAEYLLRKLKAEADVRDIIINIHNEVIFANTIISNILEHARIGVPSLKKTSLKKVIEEALLTVAQQGYFNNISINKQIPGDLPLMNLDSMQIRQVFMNLFNNSAEAMLGGGELKIKVVKDKGTAVITIADNGVGIEKEYVEKLFEPFFTTKVKGVGLGLAITKEIIENHEGRIKVESKQGKGAKFIICLPLARKNKKD